MSILTLVLFPILFGNNSDCQCKSDESIIEFNDTAKNRIIVCGTINEKRDTNWYSISGFKLINCSNNSVLEDYSEDAVSKCFLILGQNELTLIKTHLIVNEAWEIISSPAVETNFSFNKNRICVSKDKYVFRKPHLTKIQSDSVNLLCRTLKEMSYKRPNYPFEEESIIFLHTAAISGNCEAKKLLNNLEELFILDGAIKETFGELWISW